MADPFGTLVNAITLADYIFTAIQTISAVETDEAALLAMIRVNALSLRRFTEVISSGLVAGITSNEQQILSDACTTLMPDLEQFQSLLIKARSSESHFSKLTGRVGWLAYRKRRLEAIADSAEKWSSLFRGFLMAIPLSTGPESQAEGPGGLSTKHDQMHQLSNYFGRLAIKARTKGAESMKLDIEHVKINDVLGSLRSATYANRAAIVEYRSYKGSADGDSDGSAKELEEQIGRLAAFLNFADPFTMNALRCVGYIHEPGLHRYGLVFEVPTRLELHVAGSSTSAAEAKTLHSVISNGNYCSISSKPAAVTLDERFKIASMLAIGVFYLQSHNWLHEAIQSKSILLLEEAGNRVLHPPTQSDILS